MAYYTDALEEAKREAAKKGVPTARLDSVNDLDSARGLEAEYATPKVDARVHDDPKLSAYDLPPEVAGAFAKIGATTYAPQMVSAGPSVSTVASRYAVDPAAISAAFQSQTQTNQDLAQQRAVAAQQTQQFAGIRAAGMGTAPPSAAVVDNSALLQQAQNLQTSAANSARGGSDVRLAAQADALAANSGAAQSNIATAQALQAQEQEAARAQAAQVIAQQQQQDQAWMGAAYGIANANAGRETQADLANQGTATQAGVVNRAAGLQAAGADQANAYNALVANNGASIQAYRDQTGRLVQGQQGVQAAAGIGMNADAAAIAAQRQAEANQLEQKRIALDVQLAKKKAQMDSDAQDRQLGIAIAQGGVGLLTAGLV